MSGPASGSWYARQRTAPANKATSAPYVVELIFPWSRGALAALASSGAAGAPRFQKAIAASRLIATRPLTSVASEIRAPLSCSASTVTYNPTTDPQKLVAIVTGNRQARIIVAPGTSNP